MEKKQRKSGHRRCQRINEIDAKAHDKNFALLIAAASGRTPRQKVRSDSETAA
jgi:hypothetical protein